MTPQELIIDFHKQADRQGPGSVRATRRALEMIDLPKDKQLKIADLGCGTGGQTMTLAQHIEGKIIALDLFPGFLEELDKRAKEHGLSDKIKTVKASMDQAPFEKTSFDLIWSEGAIYLIGFEAGIKQWKEYLKSGGYLAVSEVTWITNDRPEEIEDFWNREYPEIDTAASKIKILEEHGFTLAGYFHLAQDAWIENYYQPMEARFASFLNRHNHSEAAKEVVREHKEEIELYQSYKDYYSYGFYIAKKDPVSSRPRQGLNPKASSKQIMHESGQRPG